MWKIKSFHTDVNNDWKSFDSKINKFLEKVDVASISTSESTGIGEYSYVVTVLYKED